MNRLDCQITDGYMWLRCPMLGDPEPFAIAKYGHYMPDAAVTAQEVCEVPRLDSVIRSPGWNWRDRDPAAAKRAENEGRRLDCMTSPTRMSGTSDEITRRQGMPPAGELMLGGSARMAPSTSHVCVGIVASERQERQGRLRWHGRGRAAPPGTFAERCKQGSERASRLAAMPAPVWEGRMTTGWLAKLLLVIVIATLPLISGFAMAQELGTQAKERANETLKPGSATTDERAEPNQLPSEIHRSTGRTDGSDMDVQLQRLMNDHIRDVLRDRSDYIDRWLFAVAIFLTVLSIVTVVGGYLGFRRFREIEADARGSATRLIGELERIRDRSNQLLDGLSAEAVADDPKTAASAVEQLRHNPDASAMEKAVADAADLQGQGKNDESLEKWRAIALLASGSDDDLAARAWFSVGYLLQDKPEDAIAAYSKSIRLRSSSSSAFSNRGAAKFVLKQYEDAIEDYSAAIRLDPTDASTYVNRAHTHFLMARYEDAIADYGIAIALNPGRAEAYKGRANVKCVVGRNEDAIDDFDQAIRLNPTDEIAICNRGCAKGEIGRHEDALADLDEALRINPDYADAFYNRGCTKLAMGRRVDAIADFTETLRLDPVHRNARLNRGAALHQLGRNEEALRDVDEVIRSDPGDASAFFNRATILNVLGRHRASIADHTEAIRLQPDFAKAYLNRATPLHLLGQHEHAIADLNQAIRLQRNNAEAFSGRGAVNIALSRHEEAISDCDESIRLDPDNASAYNNRGTAKSGLQRHADAIADYDQALHLKPEYAEALYNRGDCRRQTGHHEDAIADFDEAIRLKADYYEAYGNRGAAKAMLGRFNDAIEDFDEVTRQLHKFLFEHAFAT